MDKLGNPSSKKFRYEFRRIEKDGAPCLQVIDNYCAPLTVLEHIFKAQSVPETYGKDVIVLDLLLEMLQGKHSERQRLFVAYTDSMSRVKKALADLEDAMEDYDDATGAQSVFSYSSVAKNGEVYTTEWRQQDAELYQRFKAETGGEAPQLFTVEQMREAILKAVISGQNNIDENGVYVGVSEQKTADDVWLSLTQNKEG